MHNATILVVDDEPQIRRTLRTTLATNGCDVVEARNAQEAINTVVRERPDLILLDMNLPDMNGLEACGKIRQSFDGPILMVTVRDSQSDKIEALNSGADDYVVKPFSMEELMARVHAALRRSSFGQPPPKIETPDLHVDLETRSVEVRGERVHLTPKEFGVLRVLVTEQNKAVTYKRILQKVWGPDYGEEIEKVRVVIRDIRKKIEKDPRNPRYIVTEPWFGYRFKVPLNANPEQRRKS